MEFSNTFPIFTEVTCCKPRSGWEGHFMHPKCRFQSNSGYKGTKIFSTCNSFWRKFSEIFD